MGDMFEINQLIDFLIDLAISCNRVRAYNQLLARTLAALMGELYL